MNTVVPITSSEQPTKGVYIQTFGCQMNEYDTDRIYQVLAPHGYTRTDDPKDASLVLLNTCSVREKGEHKMLSELGRLAPLKAYSGDMVLGVAGCVAQQEGAKLLDKVPYLDLVIGPDNIPELPGLLERIRGSEERIAQTEFYKRKEYEFLEAQSTEASPPKVSEFITIMKGCDKVCSFCIVPFTRGREVSKPADMVVREVERLVAHGTREVTLLGQNVNSYGKDKQREPHFADLLRQVDAVEGLERLRFTTSHPMDCIDDLIRCFGELRTLCEYFHLPVQSGSDRVLEAMRRPYTVASYLERVDGLRAQCPEIALSTDIIVGFPGETDRDFEETMALLESVRFDSIYAFKYSERPGTRAAKMSDDVPLAVKKARLKRVLDTQREITSARMAEYRDQTVEVLIEGPSRSTNKGLIDEWQMMGRTRSNVIANVPIPAGDFWTQRWTGRLAQIAVDEVKAHSLYGRLV